MPHSGSVSQTAGLLHDMYLKYASDMECCVQQSMIHAMLCDTYIRNCCKNLGFEIWTKLILQQSSADVCSFSFKWLIAELKVLCRCIERLTCAWNA